MRTKVLTTHSVNSVRAFALVAVCMLAGNCSDSRAADSPSAMLPSELHEPLAFYEGTWKSSHKDHADVQESCKWLPGGRRHIVCNARRQTLDGMREALGVYSYDEERKEYVYHGFGSRGDIMFEHGHRTPNGFQFFSEEAGAQRRFTIAESGNGKVSTLLEESKSGGPWAIIERVEYVRTRL